MGTTLPGDRLSRTLFGRTRRAVLSLLYTHTDEAFYLRQLARVAGGGLGAVQREVNRLGEAGILRRTVRGRQVYYQADPACPVFRELKDLVLRTVGVADVLRAALAPLAGRIRVAFVHGSVVRGQARRGSDVDLLVVGDVTFGEIVSSLAGAQETLGREVNPTVYPPAEFRSRLAAGHHFLTATLKGEKVFLVGGEDELARLAQERLAHRTQKQSRRNQGPARAGRPRSR